jgi:uncharacterized protein (TIGR03083 family)
MAATAGEILAVLQASAARLRAATEALRPEQLRAPAYPTEWNIAEVLSHLGSGAAVMLARVDSVIAERSLADDFATPIWDEWKAKSPEAKAADALIADRAFLDRVTALTREQRERFTVAFGPLELDLAGALGMRLNEHALHSWDIAVTFDPRATLAADAAGVVVDNLAVIVGFVGKPTGSVHDVRVHTTAPDRDFVVALGADTVSLHPSPPVPTPDLDLAAEAFARLVYGRLDADHAPRGLDTADLDELRRAFPGI